MLMKQGTPRSAKLMITDTYLPIFPLDGIQHLKGVIVDVEADSYTFNQHFGGKHMRFPFSLIKSIVSKLLPESLVCKLP